MHVGHHLLIPGRFTSSLAAGQPGGRPHSLADRAAMLPPWRGCSVPVCGSMSKHESMVIPLFSGFLLRRLQCFVPGKHPSQNILPGKYSSRKKKSSVFRWFYKGFQKILFLYMNKKADRPRRIFIKQILIDK